jgi:hypothetical protein
MGTVRAGQTFAKRRLAGTGWAGDEEEDAGAGEHVMESGGRSREFARYSLIGITKLFCVHLE